MDKKATLQELEAFELELIEKYNSLVDSNIVLARLNNHILSQAQTAVDSANQTSSYDEKVESLVKGIQDITSTVSDLKRQLDAAAEKHRSDMELLRALKTRFSDYEIMEKKISVPKEQS